MTDPLLSHIQRAIAIFCQLLAARLLGWSQARDAQAILDLEAQVHELTRLLGDIIVASLLRSILADPTLQAEATAAARQMDTPMRDGGRRTVKIRLLGGSTFEATVPYLKPDRRKPRRGRKRKPGRRGKGGAGICPTLAALGIWERATPALTAEIVHQMSAADSHAAAFEALERRGIAFNTKTLRGIFYHFAHRAHAQRMAWVEQTNAKAACATGPLAGARVVITTDGGRCRIRTNARAGRRRRESRHRGFTAPWKEPKVLVIYCVDEEGKRLSTWRPVLDATMDDCEAIYAMLIAYLKALGASAAKELIVVADGAPWIWERVGQLALALGVSRSSVVEVLDFYHASEAVHRVAEVPHWKPGERKRWLTRALKLLRDGHIDGLIGHIKSLAVGRRAKAIGEHVGYFERHKDRMRYKWFKAKGVPRSSGAVESVVRRVVNLRLKSNGKFWLRENAQGMLLVRSYLRSRPESYGRR